MTAPDERDAREADDVLHAATDEQWRDAHEALVAREGDNFPKGELNYLWAPDLPGANLVGADEQDEAPGDSGESRGR